MRIHRAYNKYKARKLTQKGVVSIITYDYDLNRIVKIVWC